MQRGKKRGPPRKLEKMLFINHKEEQLLDARLTALRLQAKVKVMELDLERIKVRNEWRTSRKKQLTIKEAMSAGLLSDDDVFVQSRFGRQVSDFKSSDVNRNVVSAPALQGGLPLVSPRSAGGHTRLSSTNQFSRQPTILEQEEYDPSVSDGSVGAYVLGEFEKISQVVPEILRTLAKKKEKQQEADERKRLKELGKSTNFDAIAELIDEYEPDMNKVRRTVGAVKTLRQRMSLSKRLEMPKKHKPLDQMIREKTEDIGENDEYTDGTCALMKRRLEKKRRESSGSVLEPGFMQRRGSLTGSEGLSSKRANAPPEGLSRRSSSLSQLPSMSRATTSLGLGISSRHSSVGLSDNEEESSFIDEDTIVNRQRIMRESNYYRALQMRVHRFIDSTRSSGRPTLPVYEKVTSIQIDSA